MTSSTNVRAASNGGTTVVNPTEPERGLPKLRLQEARGLISLASDAGSETFDLIHRMHKVIYDRDATPPGDKCDHILDEALPCLQITEHYLLMLSSITDERTEATAIPGPDEPAF